MAKNQNPQPNPEVAEKKAEAWREFVKVDRTAFTDIANLKGEDFIAKRREILGKYSKEQLNTVLTTYSGGLTKANLKATSVSQLVDLVIKEEQKKIAAMELKEDGTKKYPLRAGTGGKKKLDEVERRKLMEKCRAFLEKKYGKETLRERQTSGVVTNYSVQAGKNRVIVKPLNSGQCHCTYTLGAGKEHKETIDMTDAAFDKYVQAAQELIPEKPVKPEKAKSTPKKDTGKGKAKATPAKKTAAKAKAKK